MFSSVPTISRIFYPAFFLIFIGTFAFVSAQIRVEPVGSEVRPGLPEVFGGKGAGGCCDGSHNPGVAGPVSFAAMEYETYRVSATYYILNDGLTTTLMLNNKGPQPIQATPTFYSLAGTRLTLAPITVPATSYIDVDMHELLSGAGAEFWEGSLKISYSGISLQLGAQVKMVDEQNGLIWAEQLVYGSKFVSSRLEALWWLPFQNTETKVVVSNTSSDTITATLNVDGTSPHQSAPLQISLAPWETRVLDILRDIAGHQNGHIHSEGGISITHTGAPGAVLARMFIAKRNKGYSAAVNFVDPEATASQRWHGSGLRFRNLNGAQLTPVIAVRNTGGQASRVNGKIIYTQPNGDAATINLPQRTIDPGTTRVFNLQSFINGLPASVTYGGIEIEYDTPKGSIITSVQSGSPNGEHVFEVPMFDPEKMPSSAGGFPWKADGDFRTVVYIKNETDVARKYTVHLVYAGGQYSLGVSDIAPHQTVAVDFRELRDSQTPDSMGRVIPLSLSTGQIAWSVKGGENNVLSGRSEQISPSGGVASTYACYNCCPDSVYQTGILPSSIELLFGATEYLQGQQTDMSCNGTPFGPYIPPNIFWNSNNINVATVDGGQLYASGVGNATISAVWETCLYWVEGGYCTPVCEQNIEYAPVAVAPTIQVTEVGFVDDHPMHKWPSGTEIDTGYTPTWKISNNPDNPVAYTKGANINMFAKFSIAPSLVPRNVKIRVKNGSTVIANKDAEIAGTTATIIDISTTSALESTVKKTTPTFDWEISYDEGTNWSSIGSSGPHTMYWTYDEPLSPPFAGDYGETYPQKYALALERATTYANASSDMSTIIDRVNAGVKNDIWYQPDSDDFGTHLLNAYDLVPPLGLQCSQHANLLRGLLRSIGINGETLYIWAGTTTQIKLFGVPGLGKAASFRITEGTHDSSTEVNPHYKFHSVVSVNGTSYDPSFGKTRSDLEFTEKDISNPAKQIRSTLWSSESDITWNCLH